MFARPLVSKTQSLPYCLHVARRLSQREAQEAVSTASPAFTYAFSSAEQIAFFRGSMSSLSLSPVVPGSLVRYIPVLTPTVSLTSNCIPVLAISEPSYHSISSLANNSSSCSLGTSWLASPLPEATGLPGHPQPVLTLASIPSNLVTRPPAQAWCHCHYMHIWRFQHLLYPFILPLASRSTCRAHATYCNMSVSTSSMSTVLTLTRLPSEGTNRYTSLPSQGPTQPYSRDESRDNVLCSRC